MITINIVIQTLIWLGILIYIANGKLMSKIYGGQTVNIEKYPSQVSVQFQNRHICGGVIISDVHVLTAASCALAEKNVIYGNIQIQSGSSILYDRTFDIYSDFHQVEYVIFHKNYEPSINWIHDIAILKLASSINFYDLRNLAGLPYQIANGNTFLIGWGINPQTGIMSEELQQLQVKSIAFSVCKCKFYENENFASTQFCLFPLFKKTSRITLGNSGSPIMRGRKILGIVSTIDINYPQRPVIYTRVGKYLDWIDNIKQNY